MGNCWLHVVEYMWQYLSFCFCFDTPKNLGGFGTAELPVMSIL